MAYGDSIKVLGIGGMLGEGSSSLGAPRRALAAAEDAGGETELLDLRELALPMYESGRSLDEPGPGARRPVGVVG